MAFLIFPPGDFSDRAKDGIYKGGDLFGPFAEGSANQYCTPGADLYHSGSDLARAHSRPTVYEKPDDVRFINLPPGSNSLANPNCSLTPGPISSNYTANICHHEANRRLKPSG